MNVNSSCFFKWDLISKKLFTICLLRTRLQLIFFCVIWINDEHFLHPNLKNEFTTTPPSPNIWWSSLSMLYSTGMREPTDYYYLNVLRWFLLFKYLIWFRQIFRMHSVFRVFFKNCINHSTYFAFHIPYDVIT